MSDSVLTSFGLSLPPPVGFGLTRYLLISEVIVLASMLLLLLFHTPQRWIWITGKKLAQDDARDRMCAAMYGITSYLPIVLPLADAVGLLLFHKRECCVDACLGELGVSLLGSLVLICILQEMFSRHINEAALYLGTEAAKDAVATIGRKLEDIGAQLDSFKKENQNLRMTLLSPERSGVEGDAKWEIPCQEPVSVSEEQ